MAGDNQQIIDPFYNKQAPIPPGSDDFYERAELFTAVKNLLQARASVSIVGERKAGKTSFLNYLYAHLPEQWCLPVQIDCQLIAPQTDKQFLYELCYGAAAAIMEKKNVQVQIGTPNANPDDVYRAFRNDLRLLQQELPLRDDGEPVHIIWLIDEIEVLQNYDDSNLFMFLRPFVQMDHPFQMVVAGYDVLYSISNKGPWSPFFNAFKTEMLDALNADIAKQLIDDALQRMNVSIDPVVYDYILKWTGHKPYFLKWSISKVVVALNAEQNNNHLNVEIWNEAKNLFMGENQLIQHFDHLWNSYTTDRQKQILNIIAPLNAPYTHPQILNLFKEKRLVAGNQNISEDLANDLIRLNQLGFLDEQRGNYSFTSECLQTWIQ